MICNDLVLSSFVQKSILENPFIVDQSLHFDNYDLKKRKQFDNLKSCVNNFLRGNEYNRFVYMSGIRGVGKTTLIYQIHEYLNLKGISKENILYFSADDINRILNTDILSVVELFVNEHHQTSSSEKLFVFVDDVHLIPNCFKQAKYINVLFKNVFLIFVGSIDLDSQFNYNDISGASKHSISPLNFNEYLSLNFDFAFDKNISKELQKCILTGEISNVINLENKFYNALPKNKFFIKNNWEHYLVCGCFPSSLYLDDYWGSKNVYKIIEDSVEKDFLYYGGYDYLIKSKIFRVLSYIAFKDPNSFSKLDLSKFVNLSNLQVQNILNTLEKLNLIFPVQRYNPNKKRDNRKIKYYFTNPNYNVALNTEVGEYVYQNINFPSILSETLVASILFKMKNAFGQEFNIFASRKNNQATFLIEKEKDKLIPVVVGQGIKHKNIISKTMNEFGSEYGIIISDLIGSIKRIGDIVYMPILLLSLI